MGATSSLLDLVKVDSPDWNQIQQIVRSNKDLITEVIDGHGRYLLHYACWKKAPSELVCKLVNDYPKACEEKNNDGWSPLHVACANNQSESVNQLLITTYPKACEERDNDGLLPLHLACALNQLESVIQLLITTYPKACEEKSNDGRYALHFACASNASLTVIQLLAQQWPDALTEKDKLHSKTPLDCSQNKETITWLKNYKSLSDLVNIPSPDWAKIQQLIQSYKKVITKVIDNNGLYLLHYACWKNAPSEFVIQLIHDYPKACEEKSNRGCYALHYACEYKQSEAVIQLLITKYPKPCAEKMGDEWYALHVACARNQTELVIKLLITKYPKACEEKTNDGWYALHYACRYNQSESVIRLLIKEYPKACEEKLNNGLYALHCACKCNQSLFVIQLLVQQFTDALTIKDSENKTPLDYARTRAGNKIPNKEIITWLENYKPSTIKKIPTNNINNHNINNVSSNQDNINVNFDGTKPKDNNDQNVYVLLHYNDPYVDDRNKLRNAITQQVHQAVVSEQYVQDIITGITLGDGFFGSVTRGYDKELKKEFAIKTMNYETSPAQSSSLKTKQKMKKETFRTEQKVLANFRHPNIAMLLAYCFSEKDIGNCYLIYELASNGSLDKFWMNNTRREQLTFQRRLFIASEVLSAMLFLHKGTTEFISCCHRDIKSANIVLKHDLSALLIDCGLAKLKTGKESFYDPDSFGTNGYICPEYSHRGHGFEPACDIFSYGVVLTELFTGKLQNYKTSSSTFNFFCEYVEKKKPLVNDIDALPFGYKDRSRLPEYVHDFAQLALDCMCSLMEKRPKGQDIEERLSNILDLVTADYSKTNSPEGNEMWEEFKKSLERIRLNSELTNKRLDSLRSAVLPVLRGLDTKFIHKIPRYFILLPIEAKEFIEHPKSWVRSKFKKKYYLYFVCEKSYRITNIDSPIKIKQTTDSVKKIAGALAVGLNILNFVLKVTPIIHTDISDGVKLLNYINTAELTNVLKDVCTDLSKEQSNDVNALLNSTQNDPDRSKYMTNEVYEFFIEKTKDVDEWRKTIVPVREENGAKTLWVAQEIASQFTRSEFL